MQQDTDYIVYHNTEQQATSQPLRKASIHSNIKFLLWAIMYSVQVSSTRSPHLYTTYITHTLAIQTKY